MRADELHALGRRAARGDAPAVRTLLHAYLEMTYRYVLNKAGDPEIADRLTSRILREAWAEVHTYHPEEQPFPHWLFRRARNVVIDHYQRTYPSYQRPAC